MSSLTDRAAQRYPRDVIGPHELPDTLPPEHPAPWSETFGGTGHAYLSDAKGVMVAHVLLKDEDDRALLDRKLAAINNGSGIH